VDPKKGQKMSLSTNMVSGLSSGFDWRSMADEVVAIAMAPSRLQSQSDWLAGQLTAAFGGWV